MAGMTWSAAAGAGRLAVSVAMIGAIVLISVPLGGCGSNTVRTTRYQAADLEVMTGEIIQQLSADPFIQSRDETSEPIVVMPTRLANYSNERISGVDRWSAVTRVLFDPGVQEVFREKNIHVMMPYEEARRMQRFGVSDVPLATRWDRPTHLFTATFRSSDRAAAIGRRDAADERVARFSLEFSLVETRTGRLEWAGMTEIARLAHGVLAD